MAAPRDHAAVTPLTPERWRQVKQLFEEVVDRPAHERAALLRASSSGDVELQREVESLLASHVAAGDFMESSALSAASEALGDVPEVTRVGQRLGQYRILREIGRGGMGTVYLAERDDDEYRKQVAIKVIKRGMDTDLIVRRFRHERQILASLDHPNVARLLDGGATDDGVPYFVMEYIEGVPLDRYAAARGLSIAERLVLFRAVCAPVQYAHQQLVVHRDLKPGNILVTAEGVPKLLDFGLAKLVSRDRESGLTLASGMLHALTPEYASPEQLRGEAITTSTDVYSLGVLLHELLTGRRPEASAPGAPVRASAAVPDERASRQLRGDLDTIVQTALREEPERRYASVEQLSDDVRCYLEALPVSARPDTFGYRSAKFVRRNRLGVAAAALLVTVLLGGLAATAWQARVADEQRQLAEGRFNDVRELVNSLLFDLDGQLASLPGSTPARALLVRRASEYLDRLSRETDDNRLLQRELATAYLKVGDIQGKPYSPNVGDTDGALVSYQKARALLAELTKADPRSLAIKASLGLAHQRVSIIQVRQGQDDEGERNAALAVSLAKEIVAAEPANRDYQTLLADSHVYLGQATYRAAQSHSTVERRERALANFAQALAIRERLAMAEPNVRRRGDVATAHANIGYGHWANATATGDTTHYRRALVHLMRAHEIRADLRTDQPTPLVRRNLADGMREIGVLYTKLRQPREAMASFAEVLPMMEQLASADPANIEARRDLATSHVHAGAAMALAGQRARAGAHTRTAVSMLEGVLRDDPTSNEDKRILREARTQLMSLGVSLQH